MAKNKLTDEEKKARKEIRRNHIIFWGLGLGGGAGLLTFGVSAIVKAIKGTLGVGNSVLSLLAEAGPVAGVALVVAGVVGFVIGSVLANSEKHVSKHLKNKSLKEGKTKAKAKEVTNENIFDNSLNKDKQDDNSLTVTMKSLEGEVIKIFREVEASKASRIDNTFGTGIQLKAMLANNMPSEPCVFEVNGETVAGYEGYVGAGSEQTKINENTKSYRKAVEEVVEAVYKKEDNEEKVKEDDEEKVM